MIFTAKDYQIRSQLEDAVRNGSGLTTNPKPKHSIQGTKQELARLNLSGSSLFWGISCKELEPEPEKSTEEVPDRGPKTESGINLDQKRVDLKE